MLGRIHSLESFSKVDGPGIRYVVFLQGCNLRCKFCHNPDTWNVNTGYEITAQELAKNIINAKEYLKLPNGGVTFTGGEPLLQIDFLIEVCKILKEEKIHIAIDTAGNFDTNMKGLKELCEYVDLFLFDIKHIDDEEHINLVGVSNEKILKLAIFISNIMKVKMWIRIVYIPGITDKNNAFKRYKKFIQNLKSVEKVEILPYHEMGKYKWEKLGIEYKLNDARPPTDDEVKEAENYFKM